MVFRRVPGYRYNGLGFRVWGIPCIQKWFLNHIKACLLPSLAGLKMKHRPLVRLRYTSEADEGLGHPDPDGSFRKLRGTYLLLGSLIIRIISGAILGSPIFRNPQILHAKPTILNPAHPGP